MEDTLRYFFSAVFQGFAAIITLGIMFYLYYLDKLSSKTEKIESRLSNFKPQIGRGHDELLTYEREGIIEYMKKYLLPIKKDIQAYDWARLQVSLYDSIGEQKQSMSVKMKNLFKIARLILVVSLISLFLVGYYEWLNYILVTFGIACIILAVVFFSQLFTFIKQILDNPM